MPDQPADLPKSPNDVKRQRQAEETLRRVRLDSETIGTSALSRQEPVPVDNDDTIELWGRRIGRGLGMIAVLILLWQLATMLFAGK